MARLAEGFAHLTGQSAGAISWCGCPCQFSSVAGSLLRSGRLQFGLQSCLLRLFGRNTRCLTEVEPPRFVLADPYQAEHQVDEPFRCSVRAHRHVDEAV